MPFTLAHAAIVYPMKKLDRRLSVSGLFAGAVIPDFEYFFRLRHVSNGHPLNELLLIDIAAALLLCFLFHGLIKKPLAEHLPVKARRFLLPALALDWNRHAQKNLLPLLFSVILGLFTHLLWDSFTHKGGLMTEIIPPLRYTFTIKEIEIPVYFMLQLLSSIAGLWIVYRMIPAQQAEAEVPVYQHKKSFYWSGLAFVSLSFFLIRFFSGSADNSYLSLLKALIGSFLYSWIIISLLYRLTEKK